MLRQGVGAKGRSGPFSCSRDKPIPSRAPVWTVILERNNMDISLSNLVVSLGQLLKGEKYQFKPFYLGISFRSLDFSLKTYLNFK